MSEELIDKRLFELKDYFDDLFFKVDPNILLDEQQRRAIIDNSTNLLIIAGAGSGKTTTMVAKTIYLIEKMNYKQSDIVVISFTRKVKEEIEDLLHDKFGYSDVNVTTFHSLGLKIINDSGYNYEKIIDDEGQFALLNDYIKEVLFNDKYKFKKFINAFSKYLYFRDGWENFSNFNEYHDYNYKRVMESKNLNMKQYNDLKIEERTKYNKTITGEFLRSKEEVRIANFLYLNGIYFEYEKRYSGVENYHPDFYIEQLENANYIEHFGVDENGSNTMYTRRELQSYLKTLKLKKNHFNSLDEKLFIVTYSNYENTETTYIEELKKALISRGYTFTPKSDLEVYIQLRDTSRDGYAYKFIEKIAIPFIGLFKQQGFNADHIDEILKDTSDHISEQLEVLREFIVYYQNKLEEKKLIDFEDMIYKAYNLMPKMAESSLGVDYKYLIIDEYQDISSSRLDLVKRMADLFDAKVMAVGDDWQTIFGYSGARIDLFKNFSEELENANKIAIENTYRNSQELIDVAGEFILKNTDQIVKKLVSKKHLSNPVELYFYDDSDKSRIAYIMAESVEKILDIIVKDDKAKKILFMGRYKKDVWKINDPDRFKIFNSKVISKKYPNLDIEYLTVHKAKGTGYDYCVLLDLNDNKYGFPSKIEDIPVVKLIRPKIAEPIDYPEERRLFYVALTRTKNKIFILVPKGHASTFSEEIDDFDQVGIIDIDDIEILDFKL